MFGMENAMSMDDLGVPPLMQTLILPMIWWMHNYMQPPKKIEQLETWKYEVMTIYPILETLIFLGINFINNMGI